MKKNKKHFLIVALLFFIFINLGHVETVAVNLKDYVITINNPKNDTILINPQIEFNFNIKDINDSFVLCNIIINDVYEEGLMINSSGNISYNKTDLRDGSNDWSIICRDNETRVFFSERYHFLLDSKPPLINITPFSRNIVSDINYFNVTLSANEDSTIIVSINNAVMGPYKIVEGSQTNISLPLIEGDNIVIINSGDSYGNNNTQSFNFTFELNTCKNGIRDGNETGIDCGGKCEACIDFNVYANKNTYDIKDDAILTVIGRSNSIIHFDIYKDNTILFQDVIEDYSHNYPILYSTKLPKFTSTGIYYIRSNLSYKDTKSFIEKSFSVTQINNFDISIKVNQSDIDEGNSVSFEAQLIGNAVSPQFKWDFNNDGQIDNNSINPIRTFNGNGTYSINLTVVSGNITKSTYSIINVYKLFTLNVIVKDNITKSPIIGADVIIDNLIKNTSEQGVASYQLRRGSYNIKVRKDKYLGYQNSSTLEYNNNIDVNLLPENKVVPSIHLINPENGHKTKDNSMLITFYVIDDSNINCSLYFLNNGIWANLDQNLNNLISDEEYGFLATKLEPKEYQWRIGCVDISGNEAFSEIRTLIIEGIIKNDEPKSEEVESYQDIDDIINNVQVSLKIIDNFMKSQKEVVEAIDLISTLDNIQNEAKRVRRDLYNLKYRNLTENEVIETKRLLFDKLKSLKKGIIKDIEVLESSEFVVYPSELDIEEALRSIAVDFNLDQEIDKYLGEYLKKVQSNFTITTIAKRVKLTYFDNDPNIVTLIVKDYEKKSDIKGKIIEIIPKTVIKSTDYIEFVTKSEVIKKDPILSFDFTPSKRFVYYLTLDIPLNKIEEIKTVLIPANIDKIDPLPITGFAFLKGITPQLIHNSKKRVFIEIFIIVLLIMTYLLYPFNYSNKFISKIAPKNKQQMNAIKETIASAKSSLNIGEYDKAKLAYNKIKSEYSKISDQKGRMEIKHEIIELCDKINFEFIKKLAVKAKAELSDNKDRKKAEEVYLQIKTLYSNISKEYKQAVLEVCMNTYNEIKRWEG